MNPSPAKLVSKGNYKAALQLYSKLHSSSSLSPNNFTFPCLLKACGALNSSLQGQILHTHLFKLGFHLDIYASTALIDMYMKFGHLGSALKVFDEMPQRENESFDASVSGVYENWCFSEGLGENRVSLVGNGGVLGGCVKVFDEMPQRNVASVNAVISGFCQNGCFKEALIVFKDVGMRKTRPNSVTIASVLSACHVVENGAQLHCWAVKLGVEMDVYVGTRILTMYMACGEPVSGANMFALMEKKNIVSYNAVLSGLVQNGVYNVALSVFKEALNSNYLPNFVTLVSVLGACSSALDLRFGMQVHGLSTKFGLEVHTMVGTALVDMYSKCGSCQKAYDLFKEMNGNRSLVTWNSVLAGMMSNGQWENAVEVFADLESDGLVPDSATWNTMISGFSQLGKGINAIQFFAKMISEGISPSLKSLTSVLPACSSLSSLKHGKEIHGHVIRVSLNQDEFLGTALIDMYMKCGKSLSARRVFNQFKIKPADPAFWNAMISGYGRNGESESAFEIFDLMRDENVQPNSATFLNILSVCSHTGKLGKGLELLMTMTKDYGLIPSQEHFGCIVDLLSRSGHLKRALQMVREMHEPTDSMLCSLLGAAGFRLDTDMGEDMAKKLAKFEPENAVSYVILSNLYAAMGRWEDAERIRNVMDTMRVKKLPGCSLEIT